jgi:hypothetical protein
MTTGWLQLLLVGLPVLMLIGAWMTLRHVTNRPHKRKQQ